MNERMNNYIKMNVKIKDQIIQQVLFTIKEINNHITLLNAW